MTTLQTQPVRFAMFDWLDESGRDAGATYAERLRMLDLADRSGFYCYHLAEHHATELSTVPSPNLFLASVAERTERIRLGALSYVMPLYEPMRLLEEICMLDQLSQGRLEIGLSRGSTTEHIDRDPEKARAIFRESLDVMLMGLAEGKIDYHGTYFNYDHAFTRLRPVQLPYPPLWYPTSHAESIDWVAANGISTVFSVHLTPAFEQIVEWMQQYRAGLEAHAGESGRLNGHVERANYGFSMHVHVAETDEVAVQQARPAYDQFIHNYSYRWARRGEPERYAARSRFDEEFERGRVLVGSPETVRKQLGNYLERSGANYFIGTFAFGSLTLEQILRSVDLFAKEVMPALNAASEPALQR